GTILGPRNEAPASGNFSTSLSSSTMVCTQKFQSWPASCEITLGNHSQRRPERITTEEPRKTGPLAFTRCPVSGNQTSSKKWVCNQPLCHADARPIIALLKLKVGKPQPNRPSQDF